MLVVTDLQMDIRKAVKRMNLGIGGRAQKDLEIMIRTAADKYVPVDTHKLRKSVYQSPIGRGYLIYNTKYARRQWYENTGKRQIEPQRGQKWVLRAWDDHKNAILQTLQERTDKGIYAK
ncbi:MAG: minor capsid protein [Tissierellia bacterium]|nr:minor capsid protein [Tissierellia bacterium]